MAPSVTVTTHPFKRINDDLTLNLEIFRKTKSLNQPFDPSKPVVLFLHGGGFVGFNREHVPPHVVQMALLRDWLLVSADYRLLPQVKGADIFEDVKDAYRFVREELVELLSEGREKGMVENVVVVGQSAGGYLSFLGGLYFDPLPLGIVSYFGFASLDEPYFLRPPPGSSKLVKEEEMEAVTAYLNLPVNTNMTPDFNLFDPSCLLDDLSKNPDYVRPEVNFNNPADKRIVLWRWLLQEGGLRVWFEDLDKSLDDVAWESFPETILIHGSVDSSIPFDKSEKLTRIIGPVPPKLFVGEGKGHSFDQPLYLGDEGFQPIEEAWKALDDIVARKRK